MPNGGVPVHMVMTPKGGDGTVLHCEGAAMAFYRGEDWAASHANATPLVRLDEDEALVLARFLSYWLHEPSGAEVLYKRAGVDVAFDFWSLECVRRSSQTRLVGPIGVACS